MKVLFDTNVWLDIILSREGFWEASLTALYDCIDEDDDLCVIATSLKDVFFLVERLKDANVAYESVERMLELARPIAVDEERRRCLPRSGHTPHEPSRIHQRAWYGGRRSVGRGAHSCAAAAGVGAKVDSRLLAPFRIVPVTFFRERGREAFRLH